jgi:glycosyl hydrolase family 15
MVQRSAHDSGSGAAPGHLTVRWSRQAVVSRRPTDGASSADSTLGVEWLVLSTPQELELAGSVASARVTLEQGQTLRFAMHRSTLGEQPAHRWTDAQIADRLDEWAKARDEIRETVCRGGWNESVGAFTQSFGSADLDASNLMLPIVGFLPAGDPRMRSTIDAIADRLTDRRGLVYRYRTEAGVDGLAGTEGTFLLCTFWLVQALALAGETGRARTAFELATGYAKDVGLLAEEVDPDSGELLGNFPQAFSHIGLVNAAWAISEAERTAVRSPA